MDELVKKYGGYEGSPWNDSEGHYCDRCLRFSVYDLMFGDLNVCSRCLVELEDDGLE